MSARAAARLTLAAWLLGGCSALGLSADVAIEGCERDADCAVLGVRDAGACGPAQLFVCGDEGFCERADTPPGADAAAGGPCADAGAMVDSGVTAD